MVGVSHLSFSFLGFPPIPGVIPTDGEGTVAAVLENADRLVKMEEEDDEEEACCIILVS